MRVLLMGDSIRMGYQPYVKRILESTGRFNVFGVDSNCEHSTNVLKIAHYWFYRQPKPDIIHLNCGLHDIKTISYNDTELLVPLPFYRRNLECVADLAGRLRKSRLILATTTPINERKANKAHREWMDFRRFESNVEAYNQVVRRTAKDRRLTLDDLHKAATTLGIDGMLSDDGVHFTRRGYKALGRLVADCIIRVAADMGRT